MKNLARSKQWVMRLSSVFFCLLAYSWTAKPALSQPYSVPDWASNEPKMPFEEMSENSRRRAAWLVSGQVLKVEHKAEKTFVTVDIDHIYAGPDALKDQNFEARFSLDFKNARLFDKTYLDTFAKGQRLLTSVSWIDYIDPIPGDTGDLVWSRAYSILLPTIVDATPGAREIESHAQRVEAVYRAEGDAARRAKMKDYARVSLPITTSWAIYSIARWKDREGYDFLRQLAKEPNVSLQQLTDIYALLGEGIYYKLWTNSEERAELIKRIATTSQSADGGAQAWKELSYIGQLRGVGLGVVTTTRLVGFYETFVDNHTVSDETRLVAIAQIGKLNLPKTEVFDFWVSLLQPDASGGINRKSALALACANEILRNAPWAPEQNAQLQELADSLRMEARAAEKEQAQALTDAATILEEAGVITVAK